jgi:HK97 family phage portal protein
MLLDSLFKSNQTQTMQYAKFLDNSMPLFSQFGRSIYASDVVQTCVDCIATELAKLQPRHIRRDAKGKIDRLAGDALNNLFACAPNELMTTADFIEKQIWSLLLNYNAFIYPTYEIVVDSQSGRSTRRYTGLYPLNPTEVDFLEDATGRLFVKMHFANGQNYTLPYAEVIHLRKKFSVNDVMGGGQNGQPDNTALLKTLEINDTLLQGVGKAIKTSMQIRGILKINSVMEDEKQTAERLALEKQIAEDGSGIISGDYKSDYQPITIDPKMVDKDTLDFIQNKILRWYGVSLPILNGTANDDEQQAFYNKTLERIIIGMNQAYSKVLCTKTERSYGNAIMFYNFALETLTVKNKIEIIKNVGDRGALTNNFILELFGIESYEGGDVRVASLNYINADIWDGYQLARAGIDSHSSSGGGTGTGGAAANGGGTNNNGGDGNE